MTAELAEAEVVPSLEFARHGRHGQALLALLPVALTVYLSFESGGFFPSSVGLATLIVTFTLLARILVAEDPFAGVSRRYLAVTATFAAYTGWTLVSALWSHAEGPALTEFSRSLLYLLLLVLFGSFPRSPNLTRWMTRSVALAAFMVCGAALITRLLPGVWPTQAGFAADRLSYPLTYWNALGLLAAIGILLTLGLGSDPGESRPVRALAAASAPVLAATLLLTLSRGAIGALIIGTVIFIVVAASVQVLKTLAAVVPSTVVATAVAYHASLLNSSDPTSAAAAAQGHKVAVVVLVAAVIAASLSLLLDEAVSRSSEVIPARQFTQAMRGGLVAVLLGAATAAGVSGFASREYTAFVNSPPVTSSGSRLTSASSDGRTVLWSAAIRAFKSSPLHGTGAGTFESDWFKYRRGNPEIVIDTHNLYLQTLAELGIVGLLLLAVTLATIMGALLWRARGPERALYGALFAAGAAWCIHGAIDWDWQMPAVSAWFFVAGGLAIAGDTPPTRGTQVREPRGRLPLAVALLLTAVAPAFVMLSETHLQHAASAFEAGDCATADTQALASLNDLTVRSQPYQILGYCQLRQGRVDAAITDMQDAVNEDPRNWEYHYSLAIARAYAGVNPRPALRAALRLDPDDPLFAPLIGTLRTNSPESWLVDARNAAAALIVSGRLTLD